MAAQHLALTAAVGQFVQAQQTTTQAAQAVQQAVAELPLPGVAVQQQVLQTIQQMQQQMQQMQQQMQAHQQQMQQQVQQQMQAHQQEMQQQVQQQLQAHQQEMQQQVQQQMQAHQQEMQQQVQQQVQAHQQEMQQQVQQQLQAHLQQTRADFRAVSNSVARLHNSKVARNQALQWLHNEQGQLPVHVPVSKSSIHEVVLQQVNALLQHYGLRERAADANMGVKDRRFLLLEYLGAESPEAAAVAY
ncbi:hypothetical protein QJQ45_011084 [Haematococcus lacustris]|nr:hypothetical protein QJQ45_011084 [Haematococcus lacustris]